METIKKIKKQYNLEKQIPKSGKTLFEVVWGAHSFGFPSQNSDFDVCGVYMLPAKKLLGLKNNENLHLTYISKDKKIDVSLDEIGRYFMFISKSNGNKLELVNSDLILSESKEFKEIKEIVNSAGISKKLLGHYLNFSRNIFNEKTDLKGLKKDLHALRTYMTGITLFEEGAVHLNLNKLNEKFNYPLINEMIELKRESENKNLTNYNQTKLFKIINKLDERLINSSKKSNLPKKPNIKKLNDFLVDLRLKEI